MQVIIRCDGSPVIGWGHVVRMLAVAQCLARLPEVNVRFAMRDLSPVLREKIEQRGFELALLPAGRDGFEVDEAQEISFWREQVWHSGDCALVDHYGYSAPLIAQLRGSALLGLVDDYLPERITERVDVLINPNINGEALAYPPMEKQVRLLGPAYAMLHPQFSGQAPIAIRPDCSRILLLFGGEDSGNLTETALRMMQSSPVPLHLTVVSGGAAALLDRLKAETEASGHQVRFMQNVQDMAALYRQQDFAILSASTVFLEASALGLPCATVICERNQEEIGQAIERQQLAVALGFASAFEPVEGYRRIQPCLENPALRSELAKRAHAKVDGMGAERVAQALFERMRQAL